MLNKNTLKGEIFEYICCQVSFSCKLLQTVAFFWPRKAFEGVIINFE